MRAGRCPASARRLEDKNKPRRARGRRRRETVGADQAAAADGDGSRPASCAEAIVGRDDQTRTDRVLTVRTLAGARLDEHERSWIQISSGRRLPRVLGPVDGVLRGGRPVIGSGIFLVPAKVAHDVPFISGIVLVWVIGGLFSGAGALTLAELGAMLPQAGGLYVYPPRGLWAAAGVPVRLGRVPDRPGRLDGDTGRGLRPLLRPALPAARGDPRRGLAGRRSRARDRGGDDGQCPRHAPRAALSRSSGTLLKVGGVAILIALPFAARRRHDREPDAVWPGTYRSAARSSRG